MPHPKIIIAIFILLISSCTFISDKKHIPEGFSKLTVVLDDSSNFYLDKVFTKRLDSVYKFSKIYDTTYKGIVFTYDSLRNNVYEIVLSSLLNREFSTSLTLRKDTTIYIKKNQILNYETLKTSKNIFTNLNENDTICVAYESSGCFHNYSSKTIIFKTKNNFYAEFIADTSDNSKTTKIVKLKSKLGLDFADTIKKLELGCLEGLKRQNEIQAICNKKLKFAKNRLDSMTADFMMFSSTTSMAVYLNKGNKVFVLSSNGINEIPYYYRFMKALKI